MLLHNCSAIILAAGKSERMMSDIPKVVHKIAGKFMLDHLIDSVIRIGIRSIYIVYGYQGDMVKEIIDKNKKNISINWILQRNLYGTGDAVQQVLPNIYNNNEEILILYGDVPLVSDDTLRKLYSIKSQCDIGLLTATLRNPFGYGRIIRNQLGNVTNIIEHNDIIDNTQQDIKEINTGVFITVAKYLKQWLVKLTNDNSKKEFYLTDIVNIAYNGGYVIYTIQPIDSIEIMGVNTKSDLIYLEREYQKKQAQYLLDSGVMLVDPNRFDLRGTLVHGRDVFIDINVIIEGHVVLGNRVTIGSGCILKNAIIKDDVTIVAFSIIENATIGFKSFVGPFARIRPGTELKEKSYVGNFVELKNTKLGKQSRASHLSYLGDSNIGNQVNIGAGTITCNYDGIRKHNTVIGNDVFIGANSQLVAPITIGNNVTIGAGTTVTQSIEEGETIISRVRQFSIANARNVKKKD